MRVSAAHRLRQLEKRVSTRSAWYLQRLGWVDSGWSASGLDRQDAGPSAQGRPSGRERTRFAGEPCV